MAKLPSLSDQERENLVAYLDGELDAQSAQLVETKLNLDPAIRAEAEALRRSWEMLDYLPRPEPTAAFTSRTLERASGSGVQTAAVKGRRLRWPAYAFGAGWAAALLIAGTAGFAAVKWLVPSQRAAVVQAREPVDLDQLLIRDLRVIDNKRLYELADDISFLRALDDPEMFGDDS